MFAFAACTLLASPLSAQTKTMKGGWEAEVHFGSASGDDGQTGTTFLPGPGPTFISRDGITFNFVSSFYFGEGAKLLNLVADNNQLTAVRMTPLDSVLTSSSATRQRGTTFGFRIGHTIGSHAYVGFTLDKSAGKTALSPAALATIESARTAFKSMFEGELTGSAQNASVTSTAEIHDKGDSQLTMLGEVNINVGTFGRLTPFVTVGGGVLLPRGTKASFTLTGSYQFTAAGSNAPIKEQDQVEVTYDRSGSIVKLFGGGVEFALSGRSGVRFDARANMVDLPVNIDVDANPSHESGSPAGVVVRAPFNQPGIQFNNNGATTLSFGDGFTSFKGDGKQSIVTMSIGYFVRF